MRRSTCASLILMLAVWAAPVAAQDFEVVEYGPFTVRHNHEDPGVVKAYWTPELMKSAIPMERSVEVEGAGASLLLEPTAVGAPGALPPVLPGAVPDGASTALPRVAPLNIDEQNDAFTHPSPFTTYFPTYGNFQDRRRALGKLFFSKPSGGNFVCSGAVVTSAITGGGGPGNLDLVLTAAHCCGDSTDGFFTNFAFVPGFTNGFAPFGVWTDRDAALPTVWLNTENLGRDVCAIVLNTNGGQHITQVTGAYGFSWNQSRLQHWHAAGWPQAPPFNGQRLVFAVSTFAHIDDVIEWDNFPGPGQCPPGCPQPHAMGSNLTGGSSGGPWLLNYCHNLFCGSGPFINGVNSFKYTNPSWPLWMFSPYFDTFINGLREFAATL